MAGNNKLYVHDNLDVLHGMNSHSVDFIYLDPPFNSKRMYAAPIGSPAEKKAAARGKTVGFHDIWVWNEDVDIRLESFLRTNPELFDYIDVVGRIHGSPMKAYLTFMAQRIIEMHRVLKDTGSIYLHCDPTASHYLKLILDEVFGKHSFQNELIWYYGGGGASKKRWGRKHDVILFYSKSQEWNFNVDAVRTPHKWDSGQLRADGSQRSLKKGKIPDDVFIHHGVMPWSKERTGYPTQKPLALLDRIIKASSNEGDLVLDPFCGCATTCVAAQNLHRDWIGIDVSDVAADLVADRLSQDEGNGQAQKLLFTDFEILRRPPVRTDLEKLTWSKQKIREHFYGKQSGNCNGCGTHFENTHHFHIDHIYPESKGGAWHLENLQLLCGNCNSIKGNRPMEYLLARIKARRKELANLGA